MAATRPCCACCVGLGPVLTGSPPSQPAAHRCRHATSSHSITQILARPWCPLLPCLHSHTATPAPHNATMQPVYYSCTAAPVHPPCLSPRHPTAMLLHVPGAHAVQTSHGPNPQICAHAPVKPCLLLSCHGMYVLSCHVLCCMRPQQTDLMPIKTATG